MLERESVCKERERERKNYKRASIEINRKKTDITLEEIEMIYHAIKKSKKGAFVADKNADI